MKLMPTLLLSAALCASTSAMAVVDTNKTPTRMGMRPGSNSAYFYIAESLSLACAANVILITLDAAGNGRTAYATILAARITGKKLAYLEYTQDVNGYCHLVQVDIAN